MKLDKTVFRRHLLPVVLGLGIVLGFGPLWKHYSIPGAIWWHTLDFILAGVVVGVLTPKLPDVDHRGTNGMMIVIVTWALAATTGKGEITASFLITDWLMLVTMLNVVYAFCLAFGIFAGSAIKNGDVKRWIETYQANHAKKDTKVGHKRSVWREPKSKN